MLSTAAKVSIALSITILFSFITLAIIFYIRRLKRDLRYAQTQTAAMTQISEVEGGYDTRPGSIGATSQLE
jgi:hypothetical protein